jgi:hypothetical protein
VNELFNDSLKTSEVILAFEERYKNIGCQVCKVLSRTTSGNVAATEVPEKIKLVGFVSGARLCHDRNMSANTKLFSFQNSCPRESQIYSVYDVLIRIILTRREPTRSRTSSVLPGPGSALGSGQTQAWGPGPCLCRPLSCIGHPSSELLCVHCRLYDLRTCMRNCRTCKAL